MKKILYSLLLAFTILACQRPAEKPTLETVFASINEEVLANSQAYATLGESSKTIGHRLTGSENGTKAEQFTYDLFKSYGFDEVEFMEFEMVAWARGSLTTQIKGANEAEWLELPSVSLAHTPMQWTGEAELVDVGSGLEADFESIGDAVKGKMALVYLGVLPAQEGAKNLHRSEKTALAIQYGAAGVLFYNSVEGGILLTGTASVTGDLIEIPAVCISHEEGFKLKERLQTEKVWTQIAMTNTSGPVKARNVIATLRGSELPDEHILVGGHLDSWDLATGAIDNGIGSFAILDMARTFKALNLQPRRTIRFIMFMGEEQGLHGSKAYVAQAQAAGTLDRVKYMMNIDMGGNPTAFSGGGRDVEAFFVPIGEMIQAIDSTFVNDYRSRAGLHSDHQPFMLEGIPTVGLVSKLDRHIYRCYHADCDDFDLVNEGHLKNTVRFSSMMLYALADAQDLPASKLDSDATRDFLIEQGLKEELVLGNEWKW
jgi:carboxypeptidase Q